MPIWSPPTTAIRTRLAINGGRPIPPTGDFVSISQSSAEYEMQGAYVVSESPIQIIGGTDRPTSQAGDFFIVEQGGRRSLAVDSGSGDLKNVAQERDVLEGVEFFEEPASVSSSAKSGEAISDTLIGVETDFSTSSFQETFTSDPQSFFFQAPPASGASTTSVMTQGGQSFTTFTPTQIEATNTFEIEQAAQDPTPPPAPFFNFPEFEDTFG